MKNRGHGKAEILENIEFEKIYQAFNSKHHKLIWQILRYTGERISAVLQLKVGDVFLTPVDSVPLQEITFRSSTRKASPDGSRKTRQVPITRALAAELHEYYPSSYGWLFPSGKTERNKATVISGSTGTGDIYERASFDLYEFTPNRDLDQKSRAYLAGPEWSILQQSSLLKAGHDILGDRLGYTINFEKWFEDFEYEFQNNLPSSKRVGGNKLKPWGKDKANRPKKLNLLTKEQAREKGYMIIRFWKDRTIENDSEVLAGTYTELRQQLLDAMRSTAVVAGDTDVPAYSTISFRGLPTIMLSFWEKQEDVEIGYSKIKSHHTFRLTGRTDDPKTYPNLSKLTNIEVVNLAKKIKDSFLLPEPYKIHRGKETVSCKDKVNGIESHLHVFNKQDGIEFFAKVYSLLGKTINTSRIFHKITEGSVEAYPTIPERTNVLGRDVKRFRERPVGYVHFTSARLFLSLLDKPIVLCSSKGETYQGTLPDG